MKLNHIGIVIKNMEKSLVLYKKMGYILITDIIIDNIQNNKLVFLKNVLTGEKIELIQPINEKSTVFNSKCGYHHICYEVEDIDNYIKEFRKNKLGIVFTNKIIAPAFNNKMVIFVYLKNDTIVEFLETGEVHE
ncbi:VOC family protein [Clostridium sp. DJ247]|uniref:VOC family protein n=1 Tax=Clostridium sp. DJ247 TaxID=2726188 RepID=UPI0016284CA8|nr:VOC family protein [Clostridium sp. DJ247]MBC2580264.1 hypothetical protein [Clostridium sp. DJ247]